MTEVIIGEALSYTLPLESVELTYLSKYVQNSRHEKMPLWSKKCLDGESEYYQIKIVAQDVNVDDCYSEPSATYKCNFCNLDVPKTCFKEHNESKIHKTYKNIFSKVLELERVSKHFENQVTINDGDISKDAYYCITCSKIVKIKNKYHHEASSYHIKSQENITILSNFYEMFKDDKKEIIRESNKENNDVDENETALKSYQENLENDIANNNSRGITITNYNKMLDSDDDISIKSETNDERNDETYFKQENRQNKTSLEENINIKSEPNDENDETNDETYFKQENSQNKTSLEENLTEVISKYKLNVDLVPAIDGECFLISTPHGKGRVSDENFHSYRLLKNRTYCQMCKMWISQDTRAHEATEIHLINILKPVDDKFGRTIDTISSHCIVCNEVVLTLSDHHTKENHNKILLDKKIANNSQNNGIVKNNNEKIKANIESTAGMKNGNASLKNTIVKSIASINSNIVANVSNKQTNNNDDDKLADYFKLFVYTDNTKTKIKCIICDVIVPYNDIIIIEHVEGKSHIDITNMGDYRKLLSFSDDDDARTHVKCRICDVNIHFEKKKIIKHMEGKMHEHAEIRLLDFHKIENVTSQYYCKGCDVDLTKFNFLDHIDSKTHTDRCQEIYDINKTLMRQFVYEDDKNDGEAPYIRGLYKNLLICNKVTQVSDTKFYCKLCDINLGRISEIAHMLGERHKLRKEELTKLNNEKIKPKIESTPAMKNGNASLKNTIVKSIASINSNNVANVSIKQTNNNDDDKLADYFKLFVYTDNTKTKIKCIICDVIVPYNDIIIIEHVEGKSHIDITNMGDYHKLLSFSDDDDARTHVKCRICDVNISLVKKNIIEHMEGKIHEHAEIRLLDFHKIKKLTSQYYCTGCDVDLTKFNFLDHINSKTHTDRCQEIYDINKTLMRKFVYEDDTNDGEAPYIRGLYKNLLICNKVTKVDDTKFYCKLCDINFSRFNEIAHMLGERHKSRKEVLTKLNNEKIKPKVESTAAMKNGNASLKNTIVKSIASTHSNNVANVSNKQTNNNVYNKLDNYYKLFVYTDDTKTIIKCIICNVKLPHNDTNVIKHIEGKSHLDSINKRKKRRRRGRVGV